MKSVYARAGARLYECGARLLLIEAILILLLLLPVYTTLEGVSSLLLTLGKDSLIASVAISGGFTLLSLAFTFFVAVPLLYGLFYLSHRLALGESATLGDLFYAFSSRRAYRVSLGVGRAVFVGCAVLYLVGTFAEYLFYVCFPKLYAGVYFVLAALLLLGYLLLPLCFFGLRRMLGRTGGAREGLRLRAAFLPWILLGIATFGILLLADVLPRLLIASSEPLLSNGIKEDGTAPSLSDK